MYSWGTQYSQVPSTLLTSSIRSLQLKYPASLISVLFPCIKSTKIQTGLQWYQKYFLTTWWWAPVVLLIMQDQNSPLFQMIWALLSPKDWDFDLVLTYSYTQCTCKGNRFHSDLETQKGAFCIVIWLANPGKWKICLKEHVSSLLNKVCLCSRWISSFFSG